MANMSLPFSFYFETLSFSWMEEAYAFVFVSDLGRFVVIICKIRKKLSCNLLLDFIFDASFFELI